MRVLAIETSCDETGIAVVSGEKSKNGFVFDVIGNATLSQAEMHAEYGGVYPTLAKREHQKNLPTLLQSVLTEYKITWSKINAIAVTSGPGLEPALWTGITFAEQLAAEYGKPLFGVNHLEGHLISSLVRDTAIEQVNFPILGLLVSGGHTQFIESTSWLTYRILGETLDDAVGECFDKVARMIGLPYPGGPHISKMAEHARTSGLTSTIKLPRPMLQSGTCDVSFSGLKTAALYALQGAGGVESMSEDEKAAFAREFEDSVADVFISKTRRALDETRAKTFVIGGGVAANAHLRRSLVQMIEQEFPGVEVRLPELSITGDNAIMIAEAALLHFLEKNWMLSNPPRDIRADGNLSLA